jgi:hypothetical protein
MGHEARQEPRPPVGPDQFPPTYELRSRESEGAVWMRNTITQSVVLAASAASLFEMYLDPQAVRR